MDINIQSIHFDADKKLLEFTRQKIQKLEVFFDRIIAADVYLKFNSASGTIKEKSAEIKLNIPGATLFASEESNTFEEAIDSAVKSMERQLKKHKDKLKI